MGEGEGGRVREERRRRQEGGREEAGRRHGEGSHTYVRSSIEPYKPYKKLILCVMHGLVKTYTYVHIHVHIRTYVCT